MTWNPTTGPTPARRKMRRNYRTKDGGDVTDRYRRQLMALRRGRHREEIKARIVVYAIIFAALWLADSIGWGARDFDAKQSSFCMEGQDR